jgi:SAM-dependent methyltransferase
MDWFENDSFWQHVTTLLFDEERIAAGDNECDAILALGHLTQPLDVLDLAAGIGRHAIAFAQRGHRVTAVDRTAGYLEIISQRAEASDVAVELVQQDMREFQRKKSFDLALNLYTSFGYFSDQRDDLRVAKVLYESLREGGCAVMEMTSKEILARDWKERDWHELADGTVVLEEREVLDSFRRASCRWTLIPPDGSLFAYRFEHTLYSASELSGLLKDAGFSRIQTYGGLDGSAYNQDAERLVAIAWR